MENPDRLVVREMTEAEFEVRVRYFHDAPDELLATMGVDRDLLPDPDDWRSSYVRERARPLAERENFALSWLLEGTMIGFSTADRIELGRQAFMHLHIVTAARRRTGLGVEAVRRSAAVYFDTFDLERLFCEPNALNIAPNRTVQAAGFRYLYSHHTTPGRLNFPQIATRWVLEVGDLREPGR